jgi:hypothetical protein
LGAAANRSEYDRPIGHSAVALLDLSPGTVRPAVEAALAESRRVRDQALSAIGGRPDEEPGRFRYNPVELNLNFDLAVKTAHTLSDTAGWALVSD